VKVEVGLKFLSYIFNPTFGFVHLTQIWFETTQYCLECDSGCSQEQFEMIFKCIELLPCDWLIRY